MRKIEPGDWVCLKSDKSVEYSVRSISDSGELVDGLSLERQRKMLHINEVELITDINRIDYLESKFKKYFFL